MPNYPNDRRLVSSKLQSEGLLGLARVKICDNARCTAIVRKIFALHGVWEVASDDIFDLIEPASASASRHERIQKTRTIPHSILPTT